MATILNILSSKKQGGLEEAFSAYSRALIEGGHRIIMLAHPDALTLPELKDVAGAELVTSRLFSATTSRYNPLARLQAKRLLRKYRPDAVMLHNNRALGLFPRSIIVNHGYAAKKTLKADHVICVNSSIKKETEALGKKSVHVLHNATTDIPPFSPKPQQEPLVIGFMGRFSHQKGADIFVQALGQLEDVPCEALIAGDGEEAIYIRELVNKLGIHKKAKLLGWVKDKKQFYDRIDVFCAPSRYEGFGLVILEAMAYGVPVITTTCDGPKDIITGGIDGILVPPEDAGALACEIRALAGDQELRSSLSKKAHETVSTKFDFGTFTRNLSGIIETCVRS